MIRKVLPLCSVVFFLSLASSVARADATDVFTGSQSGECCFNVVLDQISPTEIGVTVSLTDGATYFANTGSHLGFAFNLDTTQATISNVSAPWGSTSWTQTSVSQNGYGTFDYSFSNPGNGTNLFNGGPLSFDIFDPSGLSFDDFVVSTGADGGNYFVADFLGNNNTGESGISNAGVDPPGITPEPSSLMLLGTGLLGAAVMMRRRIVPAEVHN